LCLHTGTLSLSYLCVKVRGPQCQAPQKERAL
jgi:hypothetical protein